MRLNACTLVMLVLVGCSPGPDTAQRLLARQQAIDPPQLWLVKDLDAAGQVRAMVWTCADTPMRRTFGHTHAEVDGTPCRNLAPAIEAPGLETLRCEADGRRYAFSTQTRGDLKRDFQMTVTVIPLGGEAGPGREIRQYRRAGPCPTGWQVGDQADANTPR